jgi:hypothetical protein
MSKPQRDKIPRPAGRFVFSCTTVVTVISSPPQPSDERPSRLAGENIQQLKFFVCLAEIPWNDPLYLRYSYIGTATNNSVEALGK